MISREYKRLMYHYLRDRGYKFVFVEAKYYCHIFATLKLEENFSHLLSDGKHHLVTSSMEMERVLENDRHNHFTFDEEEEVLNDFFIYHFTHTDKYERMHMLRNINDYTNGMWKYFFDKVFTEISANHNELLRHIHQVNISHWYATTIDLNKLDEFFHHQNLSQQEIEGFYFKFFKNRKNQLKNAKAGPVVRDFLLKKYDANENKLSLYFGFFNYLKVHFHGEDVDFEASQWKGVNVVSLHLSCKLANEKICVDNLPLNKIKEEIKVVVEALCKHHALCSYAVEELDRYSDMIEVRCYGREIFTRNYLKDKLTQWLLYRKVNPLVPCNMETVLAWLLKDRLQQSLSSGHLQSGKTKNKL